MHALLVAIAIAHLTWTELQDLQPSHRILTFCASRVPACAENRGIGRASAVIDQMDFVEAAVIPIRAVTFQWQMT